MSRGRSLRNWLVAEADAPASGSLVGLDGAAVVVSDNYGLPGAFVEEADGVVLVRGVGATVVAEVGVDAQSPAVSEVVQVDCARDEASGGDRSPPAARHDELRCELVPDVADPERASVVPAPAVQGLAA